MSTRCPNCGAHVPPPPPGVWLVRCRFCQLEQQLAEPRPPIPQQPPVIVAPPTQPVRRASALAYVPFVAALAVTLIGGIVSFLATRGGPRPGAPSTTFVPSSGLAEAELTRITLAATPEAMAAITHVSADADFRMRVPLAGSRFDAVTFEWDKEHTNHVASFFFNCSGARPEDEAIRRRLHDTLGRRFEKSSQFQWQDANVYFDPNGGVLSGHVTIAGRNDTNPHWTRQSEALWDVVRAAIGLPVKVDDAAVRDWLGRGYPLSALAKVDPQTDIDRSHDALAKLFPGVATKPFINLDHTIAIDHPWFGEAELSWKNKAGAKMATVMIRPPPGANDFPNQGDIDSCVANTFGKPASKSEPDHLRGDYDTWWTPPGGGEIRVYKHMVKIELADFPFAKPMSTATWQQAVTALDACGRR